MSAIHGCKDRSWWRVVRYAVLALFTLTVLVVLHPDEALAAEIQSQAVIARTKSATLYAQIDPQGHPTTCQAQYVEEAQFTKTGWNSAQSVPCSPEALGSGTSAVAVRATLVDLDLSTTYHYRFLLFSENNIVPGTEGSFATFGIERFSFETLGDPASLNSEGEPLGQEPFVTAGGHPYDLVAYISTNITQYKDKASPDAIIKDAITQLPPGLVGNPYALARCPARVVEEQRCPAAAEVGTITTWHGPKLRTHQYGPQPLFDVLPPEGTAAEFAGNINLSTDAFINVSIRTGQDYGVTAGGYNITALANITTIQIVLWGIPASPVHNPERFCLDSSGQGYTQNCAPESPEHPFLTLASNCHQSQQATAELTSYAEPEAGPVTKTTTMSALTECATQPFKPEITTQPTTTSADTNTGLDIDLHIPQNETPSGRATADLKDATIAFPRGLAIDPSSADGLEACSEEQIGFKHEFVELNPVTESGVKTAQFTSSPSECPPASKLAEVEIKTPLINHPLTGGLYLAKQHENPFESALAVYLAVHDKETGVVLKLPGKVTANSQTGQLIITFEQNPQLPFEDLKVNLPEGPRAALTTPITCGSYSTSTELVPWSSPEGETEDPLSPAFQITEAPGGGSCATSEASAPNSPGFEAGTASPIAGSYSPLVLHLKREDGSQRFSSLSVTLPSGLTGKVAGMEQCPQADIERAQARGHEGEGAQEQSNPSCPAGSEVGTVHVGVGAGAPYYVTGHAYWAGPYEGAPFSLVIVTPAIAGPFDLGTVVVRAALFIDPSTAQVMVKSDPFPTILDGIPLDIRNVSVEITRSEFIFNPTSCNVMAVTGSESSAAGQEASLSDRFQAGGCTSLPFHPSFTASTQGNGETNGHGASLDVKIATHEGPTAGAGEEANIAKVDVQLPVALSSRLKVLQKACTEAQFAANPAGCPHASDVGTAVAHTPILSGALTGPAYLVSHGGEAFPDLVLVLQGEGVTIDLVGHTDIKGSVTYSKFETVPDAPVSSFELSLPEGPDAVLGAIESLCAPTKAETVKERVKVVRHGHIVRRHGHVVYKTKKIVKHVPEALVMPTTITGQNGAVLTQSTPIAVSGCAKKAKVVKAKKKVKHTKRHGKSKK